MSDTAQIVGVIVMAFCILVSTWYVACKQPKAWVSHSFLLIAYILEVWLF